MLRDLAPAKINLFLHVLGRREDGYHLLESLVGFADLGDELFLEPGGPLALRIEGPFSEGLAADETNLVLRAARAFAAHLPGATLGALRLVKHLPVASGIGGGSADAAGTLRLLAEANRVPLDDPRLMDAARVLGADVPVCLEARPRLMRGIGHELGPALAFSEQPALLVNPGIAVETREVFTRLGLAPGQRFAPPPATGRGGDDPVRALEAETRNDLQAPAVALHARIARVIEAIRGEAGCLMARMSGSGATCFGLFASEDAARSAAQSLLAIHYHWWVRPCRIAVPGSAVSI